MNYKRITFEEKTIRNCQKASTYILLTECVGHTGRISARGLGRTDRSASARSVQERARADILPISSRTTSVNKIFIPLLPVPKRQEGRMQRAFSAQRLKIKLIVFVGFLVQFDHNCHWTVVSVLLSNWSLYESASVLSCQRVGVGAFVAWSKIAFCFGSKVCKSRSWPLHPPFWKVQFSGLIFEKCTENGNRVIWLVDFLYQPSQELNRV